MPFPRPCFSFLTVELLLLGKEKIRWGIPPFLVLVRASYLAQGDWRRRLGLVKVGGKVKEFTW